MDNVENWLILSPAVPNFDSINYVKTKKKLYSTGFYIMFETTITLCIAKNVKYHINFGQNVLAI